MKENLHLFKQGFIYQNFNSLPKPIAKRPCPSTPLYILSYVATLKLEKFEKEKFLDLEPVKISAFKKF